MARWSDTRLPTHFSLQQKGSPHSQAQTHCLFPGSDPLPRSQAQTHCLVPRLRPTASFFSLLLVCKVWQGKTWEIFSVSYVIVFCPPNFLRASGTFSALRSKATHWKATIQGLLHAMHDWVLHYNQFSPQHLLEWSSRQRCQCCTATLCVQVSVLPWPSVSITLTNALFRGRVDWGHFDQSQLHVKFNMSFLPLVWGQTC